MHSGNSVADKHATKLTTFLRMHNCDTEFVALQRHEQDLHADLQCGNAAVRCIVFVIICAMNSYMDQ